MLLSLRLKPKGATTLVPQPNTKPLPKVKTKPKTKTNLEARGLSLENKLKIDKSDSIDKPNTIDKSNTIYKSDSIDGEAWSKTHKSNESEYYKSYLILSKLKARGIDIDKLLEE